MPFLERVDFPDEWLIADEHGVVHDGWQGNGLLELELSWNKETALTPAQRAERDAKILQEKKARKEAERAALAASGADGAAQVKAEEAKKAAMRAKQRENKLAAANPLLAKKKG